MKCAICDAEGVTEKLESQRFGYGVAPDTITLWAVVPVMTCGGCGESYTDYRGEEARTAAVDSYKRCQANLDAMTDEEKADLYDDLLTTFTGRKAKP